MLEALTKRPESFGVEEITAMRAAGHERAAIEDAAAVGAVFACALRLADCLGFEVPRRAGVGLTRRYLTGAGYAPTGSRGAGPRRYAEGWAALRRATLTTPGHSPPELRERIYAWVERDARSADAEPAELPERYRRLVTKASRSAYQVSDEDIEALLHECEEGELFELIVAISTAAGATRYAIAMDALDVEPGSAGQ
jgi:hypothetical protein